MNIIADVAGHYEALLELIKIMPKDQIILLGDLNDRGPRSREVIELAMNNQNIKTTHSNHGHMFADFVLAMTNPNYKPEYPIQNFIRNGGLSTLYSYGGTPNHSLIDMAKLVPVAHVEWLLSRPLVIETDDLLLSHAPILAGEELEKVLKIPLIEVDSIVWNRQIPSKRSKFQIFGHNSHWGLMWIDSYALCLDASGSGVLTGIHWPSKRIYQVTV
jgi:hypothetical protein